MVKVVGEEEGKETSKSQWIDGRGPMGRNDWLPKPGPGIREKKQREKVSRRGKEHISGVGILSEDLMCTQAELVLETQTWKRGDRDLRHLIWSHLRDTSRAVLGNSLFLS